jgi:small subunit ribosomal protein S9
MAAKRSVKKTKKKLPKYYYSRGRRKTSTAIVRLFEGKDKSLINGKELEDLYPNKADQRRIYSPLTVTDTKGDFYFTAITKGGGKSGQKDALALAIARALEKSDENFREELKAAGLLTVDSRVKERKKPGLKKARKKEQYSKR